MSYRCNIFLFPVVAVYEGQEKGALLLTFVLTASLSFCNVLYSRFFDHYLPNLAILEIGNMNDSDVIGSTLTGFRWMD